MRMHMPAFVSAACLNKCMHDCDGRDIRTAFGASLVDLIEMDMILAG